MGLILIPFSLVLIWKNEKKIVKYNKVIKKARGSIKQNVKAPLDENDLALVHVNDLASNS